MTLTTEDLNILKAPFAANEHKFLRGLAYITEYAITERMDVVDPSWAFSIQEVVNREGTITIIGNLTIKGVTRSNVGMDSVRETKDGNSEANEAEKSTATDALKRCARLFGIGRYLLALPKDVRDEQSMAAWLNAQGESQKRTQPQAPQATTASGNGAAGGTGKQNIQAPDVNTWKKWVFDATKFMYTEEDGKYVKERHSASLAKRMEDTGDYGINPSMTLDIVINRVMRYRALTDLFLDSSDYLKIFGTASLDEYINDYGALATWVQFNHYHAHHAKPATTRKASGQ
jgi:hypothetical protein